MKRIDARTVELSHLEQLARDYYELQLDNGLNLHQAAQATRQFHPGLDPAFYAYLADDEESNPYSEIQNPLLKQLMAHATSWIDDENIEIQLDHKNITTGDVVCIVLYLVADLPPHRARGIVGILDAAYQQHGGSL